MWTGLSTLIVHRGNHRRSDVTHHELETPLPQGVAGGPLGLPGLVVGPGPRRWTQVSTREVPQSGPVVGLSVSLLHSRISLRPRQVVPAPTVQGEQEGITLISRSI